MKKFFFCVGAQKAGTTFLYKCLKEHEGVSLTPIKELHYFDELEAIRNRKFPLNKIAGPYFIKKRIKLLRKALNDASLSKEQKKWVFQYCLLRRETSKVHKYKWLLNKARKGTALVGDLTPDYTILDLETLKLIKEHFRDARMILILRNPVQRDWSQYKMHMQHEFGNNVTEDIILNYARSKVTDKINQRSNYPRIISRYKSIFGDNLKIFLYDNLRKDPLKFVNKVLDELDLAHFENIEKSIPNKGLSVKMPKDIESKLKRLYYDLIEDTSELLENKKQKMQVKSWNDH